LLLKYGILDQFADVDAYVAASNFGFDEAVQAVVDGKWSTKYNWIAEYDVRFLPGRLMLSY
jgi:hypothetical protein